MEDYAASSDDEYRYSDPEDSVDAFDNDDNDYQLVSSKGPSTQVITKESLLAAQKEDLRRVMDMLSVREQHARTLLIFHRWDVEKLFAVYVDRGKHFLFSEAGVTVDEHRDSNSSAAPSTIMCEICIEDVPSDETTKMDCGHCFCNGCWTEHFIVKINEGQSKRIRCMAHKCYSICDEAVVRTLLSKKHPDMAEKYERFLLESYIEDNKRVKWCPSTPHCGNAIRVEDDELCEVECSCGLQFCFSCLSEAHSPCSCLMWELWAKKCRDESETVNWITVHTKPCPKCHKPVEKNGGCNLVSCICGQAFCWLCGGATGREHTWSSIAGHSCGRYKEQEKTAERAKRDLYRYMHYHNRYKAHTDSFKLESKLKETIQEKIAGNKQNLFEDQQQQLEANVEKLSKILEEPFETFEDDKVMEIRMQIINLTTIIDKLCQKMYECIENDLLGSLHIGVHNIAPYKSKGIEKASELSVCWTNEANNTVFDGLMVLFDFVDAHQKCYLVKKDYCIYAASVGVTAELDRPSGSGSSDDSGCSSRKRARKEGLGGAFFDLNLPAEFVDRN
ncbi:putative E3 ubiquitin-protein ligase [Arachis hypogaea]|nr:putative E3 ubiquitin-protein ligase [Arachis hypogaea]